MSHSKSELAAGKALKRITTIDVLQQLNLFDIVMCLYSLEELTALQYEKLDNKYITELERKTYLLTDVIPNKGSYKGFQLLQKVLQQTGQNDILNGLKKAYEDAMDEILAEEKLTGVASDPAPVNANNNLLLDRRSDSISSSSIASVSDPDLAEENLDRFACTSSQSSGSGSDDGGDSLRLDSSSPQQREQQPSSSSHLIIHVPLTRSTTATVSVSSLGGYRERSGHICYDANPYPHKPHVNCHKEQSIEVTLNTSPQGDNVNHNGDASSCIDPVSNLLLMSLCLL